MLDCRPYRKGHQGFSLVELLIAIVIIMILAAITVPAMVNTISDIRLRYTATNLGGLLQTARMQSVRRNVFYGIQPVTLAGGQSGYFVNVNGPTYANTDPLLVLGSQVQVLQGAGSGAPNETAFLQAWALRSLLVRSCPVSMRAGCPASQPSPILVHKFLARGLSCFCGRAMRWARFGGHRSS